tara:strand:- start:2879 stop:3298 length:420 start_codon:yes stop_codon:yes gene_type:complete
MKDAGFFKRVFSLIYDSLAITGIILSLSLLLVLLNGGYAEENSISGLIQFLIIILSGPCFYTYFWIENEGQTLGMQAWKIKLISQKKDLSTVVCLLRCFVSVISFLIFGIGYFLILFHKENRSIADLITDTQIIDLKKT